MGGPQNILHEKATYSLNKQLKGTYDPGTGIQSCTLSTFLSVPSCAGDVAQVFAQHAPEPGGSWGGGPSRAVEDRENGKTFFFSALGFELRALCLLGRCSTT
jgi:hypothetical protein